MLVVYQLSSPEARDMRQCSISSFRDILKKLLIPRQLAPKFNFLYIFSPQGFLTVFGVEVAQPQSLGIHLASCEFLKSLNDPSGL
jgi:hypothetical protein